MSVDVSLVICTRNNCRRLRDTLASVAALDVDASLRWELVLVNNACADETDAVAGAFVDRLPMRYLHEPRPGKSRALNRALATASGELIAFTDDDVILPASWLMSYWRASRAKEGRCFFGGPVRSRYEADPPSAALLRIAPPSVAGLDYGPAARALVGKEDFVGANWAAPAAALRAIGGFDVTLGLNAEPGRVMVGEESDAMARLVRAGWTPWYLPEAWIEHRVPASKCTREHIVERRVAQVRLAVLARYDGTRRPRLAAAQVMAAAAWLAIRGLVAPLIGRTGLLSHAERRAHVEAARALLQRASLADGKPSEP